MTIRTFRGFLVAPPRFNHAKHARNRSVWLTLRVKDGSLVEVRHTGQMVESLPEFFEEVGGWDGLVATCAVYVQDWNPRVLCAWQIAFDDIPNLEDDYDPIETWADRGHPTVGGVQ